MTSIHVLDDNTIDKIAAGEVVERPSSVVKELVENAIDAGASAVTVEIKDGGIEFVRVTDDGQGIDKSQIRNAFMRHATSKISNVSDLLDLRSLGFRGEALSSIAAVAKVELITKTKDTMEGVRFCIEGGKEVSMDDVGAPNGTTFIVRNLFFNTPVRRKFLKSAITEGSYVTDLLEQLALSRPEISFKYILNGQTKFYTTGDGDLKAIIYRIFGREVSNEMIPIHVENEHLTLDGYLGKPVLNRANRNFENYFVNDRYIKSKIVAKAIEDGYAPYLMQHRYPFCVLRLTIPSDEVDVNVHPTKMEVRFSNQTVVYQWISDEILKFLKNQEMIPEATLGKEIPEKEKAKEKIFAPEPFEKVRSSFDRPATVNSNVSSKNIQVSQTLFNNKAAYFREEQGLKPVEQIQNNIKKTESFNTNFFSESKIQNTASDVTKTTEVSEEKTNEKPSTSEEQDFVFVDDRTSLLNKILGQPEKPVETVPVIKAKDQIIVEKPEQLNFFDEKILTKEAKAEYKIIGQVFDTYWIIEYKDKMLMIDQHAAHEKVKYERILKKVENNEMYSQILNPPLVISVTSKEAALLNQYNAYFKELGFEIEDFGMNAFAIRGVPYDLFGYQSKELFEEILTQMQESPLKGVPSLIKERIATMACKAAIKGNNHLSREEMEELLDELLQLDNPYNCPHGRPTIITMSKYEVEKKFKRIV